MKSKCATLMSLDEALATGHVDRIMLDNFTPENTKKAVDIVAGRCELESSGGITFDTLRDYGECGVDYISVGAFDSFCQRFGYEF